MIEKIIALRGVGLLHDPLSSGAVSLKKVNLIYGENGRGKSTFAGICHCLAVGDTAWLAAKKTICGENETVIEFLIEKQNFKYSSGIWDNTYPRIYVFDSAFIERNLYSGSRVDPQHRESLLEFALGETGVVLKKEVDQISEEIDRFNTQIRTSTQAIETHTKKMFTVKDFLALSVDPELDRRIAEAGLQLRDARNAETIRNRTELKTVSLPSVDSNAIGVLLDKSLETIAQDAERMVKEHIRQHLDTQGEEWLRRGIGYLKENQCPFCTQNISNISLIQVYRDYFNLAYEALKKEIATKVADVSKIFDERVLDKIQNDLASNGTCAVSWNDQTALNFPVVPNPDEIAQVWRGLSNSFIEILRKKTDSPLEKIALPESAQRALVAYEDTRKKLDAHNKVTDTTNHEISTIKDATAKANVPQIENALAKLTIQRERFDHDVDTLCSTLITLQKNKKEHEKKKEEKRKQLDDFTKKLLDTYLTKINELLTRFGAGFSLEELGVIHTAGTPRTEYGFRILGVSVPLSQKSDDEPCPSFGNTLSDGDRRALALAFFLARLETENVLANAIVVVDDPVSSLDIPRRRATLNTLVEFAGKCSQMVILSHDAHFLRDLKRTFKVNTELAQFQIRRSGNFSTFESCEISKIVQDPYYGNYKSLVEYVEKGPEGNPVEIAKAIREYLEGNLLNRFPLELESARNLGEMIGKIRTDPEDSVFRGIKPRLDDLTRINDFVSPFHHTVGDRPDILTDAELKPMVLLALEIGRG